ncbi:tyrosine-type recombinase/integrase [Pseudarthrobacter sp. S3]|uniref:tyrosine-type recombinase/integrase n=1 Tax=unclassified Pseudarthrobacter TaxID=2647000 RepID=UPI003CF9CD38
MDPRVSYEIKMDPDGDLGAGLACHILFDRAGTAPSSPHSLRTFATIALDNGMAPHDLQDSLGQADPRTTRRYDRSLYGLAKPAGYYVARSLA